MFIHHRAEGVILRARATRDADEILTIFTREFGRIDVVGRSIRKGSSKLRMNTSLFSHIEVGFIQGKSYNTLTDALLVSEFKDTKKDLGKLSLFYRIAEITLALVYGQEQDENIFSLLLESFKKINESSFCKNKLKLFYCFYSFNLLYFLGYKMYIEKCAFCSKLIDSGCYFNAQEGGVVCRECFKKSLSGIYIEDIQSLKCFFEKDTTAVFNQDAKFFINILEKYLAFVPEAGISFKKENI